MKTIQLKLSDTEQEAFSTFFGNKKLLAKCIAATEEEDEDEDEDAEEDEDEDEEDEKPKKKVAAKKTTGKKKIEDEEDEDEDDEEGYTQDRVREKCQQLIQKGKAAKLKEVLGTFGYTKVVQLKPKDFEKFMLKANKIK